MKGRNCEWKVKRKKGRGREEVDGGCRERRERKRRKKRWVKDVTEDYWRKDFIKVEKGAVE